MNTQTDRFIKAEQSVLATLMGFDEQFDVVSDMLKADDFSSENNKMIYQAISDLAAGGKPYDLVMVSDLMAQKGQLSQSRCSESYLSQVFAAPAILSSSLRHHADLVVSRSARRNSMNILQQGIQKLESSESKTDDVNNDVISAISNLEKQQATQEVFTTDDMIKRQIEHIEKARNGVKSHVDTGFPEIDKLMQASAGDLVVVAGRPSMGKSLLVVNMQTHLAKFSEGESVFFSVEMEEAKVSDRIFSSESNVPINTIKSGHMNEDQWARFMRAATDVKNMRLTIVRKTDLMISQIRTHLNKIKREKGKVSSIGIDYLGLMYGLNGPDSVKKIGDVTRALKALASEFACPVFLLCQLNRSVEQRPNKRPLMSDLRDSGTIEQDADQILFVYRDDYYKEIAGNKDFDGIAEIIIAKNRNGETGVVRLQFEGAFGRFANFDSYTAANDDIPAYGYA